MRKMRLPPKALIQPDLSLPTPKWDIPRESRQTFFWVIIGVVFAGPNPKVMFHRLAKPQGRRAPNRHGSRVGITGINGKNNFLLRRISQASLFRAFIPIMGPMAIQRGRWTPYVGFISSSHACLNRLLSALL